MAIFAAMKSLLAVLGVVSLSWLINHPHLGEYIRNFRENRAIPLRVKVVSVSLVWLTIGFCIVAVVGQWWWAQAALALLAAAITWHILSYDTLKK